MVESHAVLQVADGVLDLGVAAMVGLQFQGVPVSVGDAAVIAVVGEYGQMGAGRGLHPSDDEPHRCGVGLTLKGDVAGLRHVGDGVCTDNFCAAPGLRPTSSCGPGCMVSPLMGINQLGWPTPQG